MAQFVGDDEIESLRVDLAEIGKSLRLSFRRHSSSSRSNSFRSRSNSCRSTFVKDDIDDERASRCDEINVEDDIGTLRPSLFDENNGSSKVDVQGIKSAVDATKLGALERQMFVENLIKDIEHDNLRLLQRMRERLDKVGVELPRVEVRYNNLRVEAECEVVHGKPLPTLWNSLRSIALGCAKLPGLTSQEAKITIINDVNGIIKPG